MAMLVRPEVFNSQKNNSCMPCVAPVFCHVMVLDILGDPGATSRNDAIFLGVRHFWHKSLFQGLKSPWALFRVPEVSKSVPLIGQKNIFLANQRGDLAG